MSIAASPLVAFHLIGDRNALETPGTEPGHVRPALFGEYHDLSRLRTDYPLVLVTGPTGGPWIKSLSDIVDELIQRTTEPGTAGEEKRRQILALEQVVRDKVYRGQAGLLSTIWDASIAELVRNGDGSSPGVSEKLEASLRQAAEDLPLDGELIGFDVALSSRLVTRAWQESETLRSQRLQKRIDRLSQKLSDILKVNFMHSPGARKPKQLESSVGSADRNVFDFQAMARVLKTAPKAEPLPESRRLRIQSAIDVLESQRFVCPFPTRQKDGGPTYNFSFDDCEKALTAFRERLSAMASLVKAISIAELEIDNHYNESRHDEFFEHFDEHRLGPRDLDLFPRYLVLIEHTDDAAQAQILGILRAGLPFKILAQADDILGDDTLAAGQLSFGTQGQQLAKMALGLGQVFVLQSSAASLYRVNQQVFEGLSNNGPALFSVYCGSGYLESAAAQESRVFPYFVYNPASGPGQATRFSLADNPQPENDWPMHSMHYENPGHDYSEEQVAFTLVDFVAQFSRFAGHFACIHQSEWNAEFVSVAEFLALTHHERADKVPYVPLIDDDNILYRAVIDEKLMDAAERCREAWHGLQELGGINNSHAAAAVAEAKKSWLEEYVPPAAPAEAKAETAPTPQTEQAPQAAPEPAAPVAEDTAPSSDDPWIETIRCTTCNECTQLNDRMFGYDAEKRAYIKDPDAGTYRELVEAAESCQVAIIHPGKPRNPDEPGLEELLQRAAPFL